MKGAVKTELTPQFWRGGLRTGAAKRVNHDKTRPHSVLHVIRSCLDLLNFLLSRGA